MLAGKYVGITNATLLGLTLPCVIVTVTLGGGGLRHSDSNGKYETDRGSYLQKALPPRTKTAALHSLGYLLHLGHITAIAAVAAHTSRWRGGAFRSHHASNSTASAGDPAAAVRPYSAFGLTSNAPAAAIAPIGGNDVAAAPGPSFRVLTYQVTVVLLLLLNLHQTCCSVQDFMSFPLPTAVNDPQFLVLTKLLLLLPLFCCSCYCCYWVCLPEIRLWSS